MSAYGFQMMGHNINGKAHRRNLVSSQINGKAPKGKIFNAFECT
jgi:hypothetical protein